MLLCNRMAGVRLAGARRASRRLRPSWGAGDNRTLENEGGCKRTSSSGHEPHIRKIGLAMANVRRNCGHRKRFTQDVVGEPQVGGATATDYRQRRREPAGTAPRGCAGGEKTIFTGVAPRERCRSAKRAYPCKTLCPGNPVPLPYFVVRPSADATHGPPARTGTPCSGPWRVCPADVTPSAPGKA